MYAGELACGVAKGPFAIVDDVGESDGFTFHEVGCLHGIADGELGVERGYDAEGVAAHVAKGYLSVGLPTDLELIALSQVLCGIGAAEEGGRDFVFLLVAIAFEIGITQILR